MKYKRKKLKKPKRIEVEFKKAELELKSENLAD